MDSSLKIITQSSEIGARLQRERKRLGMNQNQLAEVASVKRNAQSHYEKGERFPDANYLAAVAQAGVDVGYVLTGIPSSVSEFTPQELLIARSFREASEEIKTAMLGMLGFLRHSSHNNEVTFSGTNHGQIVHGNQNAKTIYIGGSPVIKKRQK
ncbi:helix-turn-helix transcriptional regulator [Xylella taiwanensis]|uniref:Helix-turn-helix domain-containing protein n=1 Tax=Xylella taiwanensis TaxID=1444770 RepID=Z9JHT2_9GAMM|nr:helix-turn-helix transcriptional regulator [Xylella taiwanensis]AXI82847.1 hypothetical protein AB672_02170 [Xylella taiwanensis]EWS77523.1 XRE family transcriptional regulator [Xylella taiwanensis]MCD8455856.1 helix-turn-helix domain-containing protein [Xylella taiwanensis]MCD8458260.1 helix-turn-helix domain-containing protein [Xylella taiwanensis]MCD8460397.1 helix-turn-helix domain-containing protein [Xylella taiwanensis]